MAKAETSFGTVTVETRSGAGTRLDIQGLRGIAVLLVVAFHAGLALPGGFTGVDVFFVISGFVITRMLIGELERTGRLRLGNFYARRARRLLPALTLVLAVVAVASTLMQNPLGSQQTTSDTGIGAALFSANAVLFSSTGGYFDAAAESNPLLHTWTLAVEEQFYLVFPLLLIAAWSRRRGGELSQRRRAVVVVAIALIFSLLLSAWLTYSNGLPFNNVSQNRRFAFYGSPTRAWEFGAGALLALVEPQMSRLLTRRTSGALLATGIAALAATVLTLRATDPFPGYLAAWPVLSTVLLIGGGTVDNILSPALTNPIFTWLGDLSYGWYLWHWPAIVFVRLLNPDAPSGLLVAAAIAALLPTWASYRLIEAPVRANRTIVGRRAVALAGACVLISGVAFGGLRLYANHPDARMRALITQYQPHYDLTHGCAGNLPNAEGESPQCTWKAGRPAGTILLLGDSNAGQFAEPVQAAANALGYDFELATYGGCLVGPLEISYSNQPYSSDECREFSSLWSSAIVRTKPALVVLATASGSYMTSAGVTLTNRDTGHAARSESDKRDVYLAALLDEVGAWDAAGVPTLLVHQLPHFPPFDLRECPSVRVWSSVTACGESISVASANSQVAASNGAESEVARRFASSGTLDLMTEVCDRSECRTTGAGEYLYRDSAHISVPLALRLTPKFQAAMRELLR